MRSRINLIAVIVALFALAGCEDEPVTTLSVNFDPQSTDLTGRDGTEATVLLRPSYNLDPSMLADAEWSVVSVTGYVVDLDGDGTDDNDVPGVEAVALNNASYYQAEATFVFQGIYIIQVEVTDTAGRVAIGQVKVTVGDGTVAEGYLPLGPATSSG